MIVLISRITFASRYDRGGKDHSTGDVDVAIMQSLCRRDDLVTFLDSYGQVIIDECHHISAFSFESLL